MARKYTIAYGLLLVAVLLLSLALLPGRAYARYDTAVGWNTVIIGPQDPVVTGPELPVLTASNQTLEFILSDEVKDPELSLETLLADQSFAIYDNGGMTVIQSDTTVTIQLEQVRPPAGTYRLVITWENEETAETETAAVTFFINYSDV